MNLPTEEDVLVALVLKACRPVVTNCDSTEQTLNQAAWDQACNVARLPWEDIGPALALEIAYRRMAAFRDLEAVIADSERRLEVWGREREVLDAMRSFEYPRGSETRLLDDEPTPDEVLRWAWTMLGGAYRRVR